MIEVGAFEAKTHLSALLDKVYAGQEILITKRGKAVACLMPVKQDKQTETQLVIDKLLNKRKQFVLGGLDWKELRDMERR